MRIVSFDPGETTGFCEALVNPHDDGKFQVVKSAKIAWGDRFWVNQLLAGVDEAPPPDTIVVESFHLYAHKAKDMIGNSFKSSEMIGIISTYAHIQGLLERMVFQPASCMTRVQILPEHAPHLLESEHARDAYRHLRYYIVTHLK